MWCCGSGLSPPGQSAGLHGASGRCTMTLLWMWWAAPACFWQGPGGGRNTWVHRPQPWRELMSFQIWTTWSRMSHLVWDMKSKWTWLTWMLLQDRTQTLCFFCDTVKHWPTEWGNKLWEYIRYKRYKNYELCMNKINRKMTNVNVINKNLYS